LGLHEGNPTKVIPLRQSKGDLVALPFPTEAFKSAWADWTTHRVEKRKPITPLSAKKSLADLAAIGEARAIAAIHHSIANGWQGIFEPTGAATSQAKSKPLTPTKLDWE
jgi:NAD-dependent oxidoreductase involved in siderophore biosynthesis